MTTSTLVGTHSTRLWVLVVFAVNLASTVGARAQTSARIELDLGAGFRGAQTPDSTETPPSYSRTLVYTMGGGAVGAAVVGGLFALSESQENQRQSLIGGTTFALAVGSSIGFWLGQSFGGSRGGSWSGRRISRKELLLPSALWTGAGITVAGLIGAGLDGRGGLTNYKSYDLGAAVGGVVSALGMSWSVHRKAGQESGSRTATEETVRSRKSPWGAVGLSLMLPGGGQAYNGQWRKGALMLAGGVVSLAVSVPNWDNCFNSRDDCGLAFAGLAGMGTFWVWSMIDARASAREINRRIDAGQVALEIGPQLAAPNGDSRVGISLVRVRL